MPGARATALQNVFAQALAASLRTVSYDNFAACFPTPAAKCAAGLRAVWAQMVERLEGHAKVPLRLDSLPSLSSCPPHSGAQFVCLAGQVQ